MFDLGYLFSSRMSNFMMVQGDHLMEFPRNFASLHASMEVGPDQRMPTNSESLLSFTRLGHVLPPCRASKKRAVRLREAKICRSKCVPKLSAVHYHSDRIFQCTHDT